MTQVRPGWLFTPIEIPVALVPSLTFGALVLVALPLTIQALCAAALLFGNTVSVNIAWAALVLWLASAAVAAAWLRPSTHNLLGFSVLLAGALTLSAGLYDFSYDGFGYHIPAIQALAGGWNPVYQPWIDPMDGYPPMVEIYRLAVEHYPLGSWVFGAVMLIATSSVELGKVLGFIYLLAAGSLLLAALIVTKQNLTRFDLAAALLVVLNPIATKQALSFYVDGHVASLVLCALAGLLLSLRGQRGAGVALFASLALLCNTKLSGLPFAFILGLGFIALIIWRGDRWVSPVLQIVSAIIVGGLVIGFHPYVTNTLHHTTPFYPSREIILPPAQIPGNLREANQPTKLLYALFAAPEVHGVPLRLKFPFQLSASDVDKSITVDTRGGGFGPLSGAVVLTVVVVVGLAVSRRAFDPLLLAAASIPLLSAIVFPDPWWVRYIPHLWTGLLMVCIALTPIEAGSAGRRAAILTITVATLNLMLACGPFLAFVALNNLATSQMIAAAQAHGGALSLSPPINPVLVRSVAQRLARVGVSIASRDQPECAAPQRARGLSANNTRVDVVYCLVNRMDDKMRHHSK